MGTEEFPVSSIVLLLETLLKLNTGTKMALKFGLVLGELSVSAIRGGGFLFALWDWPKFRKILYSVFQN